MYISKIEIENFRNFKDKATIEFNDGMNVIIGHNNSGKSNLLRALSLIFSNNRPRPDIDDFNKEIDFTKYFETEGDELKYTEPPKIKISVYIEESKGKNEKEEDNYIVYDWRIQVDPYYIAKLTYEFFLPEKDLQNYQKDIKKLIEKGKTSREDYLKLLKRKYITKYIYRIYVQDEKLKNRVDFEQLSKFDFQFLDAIRDVEKELFTGKNTLLKDVLIYFLDYNIKTDKTITDEVKNEKIEKENEKFDDISKQLIQNLVERIDIKHILDYTDKSGASICGQPKFNGEITEIDILSALKLFVEKETGIDITAKNNGLGYNNLIYMAILLSKMQMYSTEEYINEDDRKIYPMLVIEEPEAHLHPSMQFKFLKFLKKKLEEREKVRQVFITTHSTHITSAVELDEIIILNRNKEDKLNVAYPGKVFFDLKEDQKSKAYVKRFLDATKSDMLFSKGSIFVEGIAEQLLMSALAQYVDLENDNVFDLEDNHISVINIGGRYFQHFLKIFDTTKEFSLNKKVACITDNDPTFDAKKCFPFELDNSNKSKYISNPIIIEKSKYEKAYNIKIFYEEKAGKTFEFALAYHNPDNFLLITSCMSNKEEIEKLMEMYKENKSFEEMMQVSKLKDDLKEKLKNSIIIEDEDEKKRILIATRYYQSVENSKGEHALELNYNLKENLTKKGTSDFVDFKVPKYIKDAIEWVCKEE
ncbi:AAA family ATPase [Caloranaerobacter sp. DY30410]|uniref:AAA family ATPase n=1 Tax=Caloranaerobacter sp. DY30410 TaxID=3238305 RepID=UPI003CFD7575